MKLTRAEDIKPYDAERSKGEQVEEMFDSIAPAYDFMNAAMTFGLHKVWLEKALKALFGGKKTESEQPAPEIIDLATGTGDVAFRLAKISPESAVTGVDLSEGMLAVARKKLNSHPGRITFEQGDCLNLKYDDEHFDILTIAYGVRNFENLAKGFAEFHRVLKPGGKAMILELSRPGNKVVRPLYDIYSRTLIPLAGRMISKDSNAYSYLPRSIAAMPPRERIVEMLKEAGFRKVEAKPLTFGVVTYYLAEK